MAALSTAAYRSRFRALSRVCYHTSVGAFISVRSLTTLSAVCLLTACSQAPAAPSGPVVPTGPLILRAVVQSSCSVAPGASPFMPEVRTRITVTDSGTEWVGTASSAAAGSVEVRFHQVSTAPDGVTVTGTVRGVAIHMPELVPSPVWDARIDFGADGHSIVNGTTFGGTAVEMKNGVDGTGTGAITVSDTTGRSCTGNAFTWSLSPSS